MLARALYKWYEEKGDVNIAGFAIALPILLLLVTAAIDIARLPIVKQQMLATMHAGFDNFIDSNTEVASARNWCDFIGHDPVEHPFKTVCADCGGVGMEDTADCISAKDTVSALVGAEVAIDTMLSTLQGGANYAFLQHNIEDIEIVVGIYNLLADTASGAISEIERVMVSNVDTRPSNDQTFMPAGSLDYAINLDDLVGKQFENNTIGFITGYGSPDPNDLIYTHVGILAAAVVVRVNHLFPFSKGLTFGATPQEGGATKEGETTLIAYLFRPLPRNIRLSGETPP